MIKILAIGDSHIPQRAKKIPDQIHIKLNQITETDKFDYLFFTGDVISAPKFMNFLKDITKEELYIVMGNMDYYGGNHDARVHQQMNLLLKDNNPLVIGLTHGHQISPRGDHSQLETLAIQKNINILISGHTHKEEITLTEKNILLLNPGSVTGAWSFVASRNPSFIVLQINEITSEIIITLYQYDIRASNFRVSNCTYVFDNNKIHTKTDD
ncbi:MAG: YfcE family phosphodiesterase [Candidatus Lokiarchaeota archaeon]|nr:YfcE family phosphodiesterase [Candidatus Lokiarchaeota archaeon]